MISIFEVRMEGNKIAWIVVIIAFGYTETMVFFSFLNSTPTIIHWYWPRTTFHAMFVCRRNDFFPIPLAEQNEPTSEWVRAVRTLFTLCKSVNMLIIPQNKLFACIDTTIGKQIYSYSHLIWFLRFVRLKFFWLDFSTQFYRLYGSYDKVWKKKYGVRET